jgi:citrate synthase
MIQGQGQLYRRPAHGCLMNTMRGPKQLFESEDRWVTSMGAWFPGERVVLRGQDLFHDLKDLSWMALLLYGITGRILDERQGRLFEGIWVLSTSFPESRLWNNRVAALAGTSRSTGTLGVSAAIAVSEAIIYGHKPLMAAMDFLLHIKNRLDNGADLYQLLNEELDKAKASNRGRPGSGENRQVAMIPGYGRPLTHKDERIQPLMQLAKELRYADGPVVKLAFQVEQALLQSGRNLYMNVAALMAALAADQRLTPRQFYYYVILCFTAGIIPCAIDASIQPAGTFFPLRCNRIQYEGNPRRLWGRHS